MNWNNWNHQKKLQQGHMRKQKIMKGRFLILFTLLFHTHLFAQDTLTIDQAVATALQNNFDIQIARNDSIIAAVNYDNRNAAFLPSLNANGTFINNNNTQSQTYQTQGTKTRTGILTGNANANISMNWVVFNGFQMFINRSRLRQLLELGSLSAVNQVVNTISDVIRTYYDIVRQEQQLRNIQEQLTLLNDQLKLAQYKFELGAGIKPDVLQAQIDYNQQKAAEINQKVVIQQRKQSLALLMNVSQNINFEVNDAIPVRTDLSLADMLNGLEQASPALQIGRQNIAVAETNVRLARANLYPTLAVTTAYNFTRNSNNAVINPNFQPLININRGFNYGITASIPIFNQFSVRQQIKLARINVNYQQQLYDRQKLTVNDSLLNTYRNYEAQQQIVAMGDSSIAWARENLNIVKERYRLGVTTFIELRQAEQNLEQTETTLITARYNLKLAETELLRLRGDLLRRKQ